MAATNYFKVTVYDGEKIQSQEVLPFDERSDLDIKKSFRRARAIAGRKGKISVWAPLRITAHHVHYQLLNLPVIHDTNREIQEVLSTWELN